jgi:hypothetical protein
MSWIALAPAACCAALGAFVLPVAAVPPPLEDADVLCAEPPPEEATSMTFAPPNLPFSFFSAAAAALRSAYWPEKMT